MARKPDARTFGQDLMRGEHVVGGKKPKTLGAIPQNQGALLARDGQVTGTSIFDPVLCELAYRWFCPPGGQVIDPFAGGSVRGVVAGALGRHYFGIDLRAEQIAANELQADAIFAGRPDEPRPRWAVGDSRVVLNNDVVPDADMVFTCPPYADLEVYSEDPRDISTMAYPDFLAAYRQIIALACARLKPDRFAVVVVGEVRGADGNYYGFVPDTVRAFMDAGLAFYNEAILVTAVGSLPQRTRKQFTSGRKFGRTHQNVLVFVKGSPQAATSAIGAVEFGEGDPLEENPE